MMMFAASSGRCQERKTRADLPEPGNNNIEFTHMKHFRRIGLRLMMSVSLFLLATTAAANDYLEVQNNYSVYATGRDAIHVKVPIWAYGRVNNYYLSSNSYLFFQEQGTSDKWFAVWFQADREGDNLEENGKGSG